ncbi:MAG: hypothetical protein TEF_08015 [Rhizobiales bacterium NRL2]|jgi:uncharacterized protein YndB with AHSA1/START domain|nr:MAG: hypothetical protein TEF_08015 [Rhizobiales bacterium NRL2]
MAEPSTQTVEADGDVWRLVLHRHFSAPLSQVWRAFADPARLARWFHPEGMETDIEIFRFEPGGGYSLTMRGADGARHPLRGRILEIDEGRRLKMTWLWTGENDSGVETVVTFEFAVAGDGTELRLTHERFADADTAASHSGGWESSLNVLADYLVESDAARRP